MDPQHPIEIKSSSQPSHTTEPSSQRLEIPTTEIITAGIEKVRETATKVFPPSEQLSTTGQTVAHDLSQVAEDTETLLWKKNRDDLIQRINEKVQRLVEIQRTDPVMEKLRARLQGSSQSIWQNFELSLAMDNLWNLTKSLLTSKELRNSIVEGITFGQSLISYTTTTDTAMEGEENKPSYAQALAEQAEKTEAKTVGIESEKQTKSVEEIKPYDKGKLDQRQLEEQRNKLVRQWVTFLGRVKGQSEYQQTFSILLENLNLIWSSKEEQLKDLNDEEHTLLLKLQQMIKEIGWDVKELFERLANVSLDDSLTTWQDIWTSLTDDQDTRSLFKDATAFSKRVLSDPSYSNEEIITKDAQNLVDRFANLKETYRPRIEHLLSLLRYYGDRIARDPHSQKLSGDLQRLTWHLFYDAQGNPTFKPELLVDLQRIIPAVLRHLRFIKLPDIEIHEPGLDFTARNLVIDVGELVPHHLRLTLASELPEVGSQSSARSLIDFEMDRIHAEARDITFTINKTGIPPLDDVGLADFRIYEEGMQVAVRLEPVAAPIYSQPSQSTQLTEYKAGLQVTKCLCQLNNFDLSVHGSGHDWMYYLLGPYIRRRVRQRIEESVVNYFMTMDLMTSISMPSQTVSSSQPVSTA